MWDHDHWSAVDYRCELLGECLPVYDESLGTPEPVPECPVLPAGELGSAGVSQWIVHGENRGVPRGKLEQTGVVVLVNVNHVGLPSVERPSYPEHPRNRGDRPNAARDHHYFDSLPLETREQPVSLGSRAPELEGMRAAQDGDVVTGSSQRPRLLRPVLQQEITDDQNAHLMPVQDPSNAE